MQQARSRVRLARRQVCKDVTLWPLVRPHGATASAPGERPEIWCFETAVEDGFLSLEALDGSQAVRVASRAAVPVAVLAGEPLGAAGVAGESRVIPARASLTVRLAEEAGTPSCSHCRRALVAGFRPEPGQVGFVLALQDRAVALEWLSPGWLCRARLGQRLRAWAPWLLAQEDPCLLAQEEDRQESQGRSGPLAPEDLLAALDSPAHRRLPPGEIAHEIRVDPARRAPWSM